uniref:AB hydrolase-1 domain-containing protein n=1 Tax=Clastoptera arizonana TaxID=38151 RepID=A0A1B6D1P8_9HEMI
MEKMEMTEISIPVPWGIIAGKAWGDENNYPVLCVHGVFDNCDALNNLIQLLPESFYYVCIDFPGHGKSSPYPPGFVLVLLEYISSLLRVVNHFKWDKFYYLGHSAGSVPGILLASIVPEKVEKLILIDAYGVMINNIISELIESFERLLELEKRMKESQPPSYTLDEAVERVLSSRGLEITSENVKSFIGRSLIQRGEKFVFTTDQRFKINPYSLSKDQIKAVVVNIRCPVLFLQATETQIRLGSFLSESEFYLDILRDRRNVKIENVEGDHDVHITHPERLVPHIKSFLFSQLTRL